MSTIVKAINEVKRLRSLTGEKRAREGVNANDSQLKSLLKTLETIERNKNKKHSLSSMGVYVSDYASQNSRLLILIDKVISNYGI